MTSNEARAPTQRPDEPRRVLIITADMGGGHNATARALEEGARKLWPTCEVRWVDTLDAMGRGVGPAFRGIYVVNVQQTPWLYEFFYDSLKRWRWFAASSKRFVGEWSGRRLERTIRDYEPDLILSTYPLGTAGVEWLRRHRGLRTPIGAWVSDFAPHPFWVYRDIDLHLVMHETAIAPALAAEPRAVVEVCAPPVTSDFCPGDMALARRRLGLSRDALVALVSAGAYGFGNVEAAVTALLEADPSVQVVVACGRNDRLRQRLTARTLPRERLLPLGWVEDMPTWLRASTVVVTNAGGATALEALACGCPVVMVDPIAAHGRANAELMAQAGLALLCPTPADLTAEVRRLVHEPGRLTAVDDAVHAHLRRHDRDTALLWLGTLAGAPAAATDQPRRLRSQDAFFLHVETPRVAQQVGAMLVLGPVNDTSLTLEALTALLAERIPTLPTLRRRLVGRGRWATPRWVTDPHVDPAAHVGAHRLGTPADLSHVVDDFFSAPLDRRIPLWRVELVLGLEAGRSALLIKLHHSLGDGLSIIEAVDGLLDTDTAGTWATRPARASRAAASPAARAGSGQRSRRRLTAWRHSRRLAAVRRIPRGLVWLARAGQAPPSPFDGRLPGPRRHLVTTRLPADLLRSTAHSLDVRRSELALALTAGAMHRLMQDRGIDTRGMSQRAIVPISLRNRTVRSRGWGNWTGAVTVDLPVGPMTEAERLALVSQALSRCVRSGQPHAAQLVMRLIGLLPYRLHGVMSRVVYRDQWFNAIVSYIPGRQQQRFLAGARLEQTHPVLPVAEGVGLSIGVMPWGPDVGIGITVDPGLVPDADALPEAFAACLHELHDAGRR